MDFEGVWDRCCDIVYHTLSNTINAKARMPERSLDGYVRIWTPAHIHLCNIDSHTYTRCVSARSSRSRLTLPRTHKGEVLALPRTLVYNTIAHTHTHTLEGDVSLLHWRPGGVFGCSLKPRSVAVHVEADTSSLTGGTMHSSPGDDMTGGEACNPPERGGGQHCFVRLEPLGAPAPNLVVALEHEFMHVQRRPGAFRVDRVEF